VRELLAAPDSSLGRQLFPLKTLASDAALRLQVTYSARQPAATDWISRISRQLDLQIDLLGGHVEVVGGSLAGRLEIAVRFGGGSRSVAELQGELRRLGILAEVLEQPAALQEAV
jgi:D-methionine transport system ATP-binding protein